MAIVLTDDKHYKAIAGVLREAMGMENIPEEYPIYPSEMSGKAQEEIAHAKDVGYNTGYEEGYKGGYDIGWEEGYYTSIGEQWEEGYASGKQDGKQEAYNTFWDAFQNGGEPMNYRYAFIYSRFTDDTYNPKYPIKCNDDSSSSQYIFYSCPLTSTKVEIVLGGDAINCFNGASNLHTITLLTVNKATKFSGAFNGCSALANIVIEGEIGNDVSFKDCVNLTEASIKSIVDHLSGLTSGKTLTLSEAAVNKAFETSEGANDGSSSVEWDVLGGANRERQNWTISLV